MGFSAVSIVSALLSVVVAPVSTHLYSQEQLGTINLFFSAVTVLYSAACLGLDQAYVRFYSMVNPSDRRGLLTFNLTLCLGVVAIVAVLCAQVEHEISLFLFGEYRSGTIAIVAFVLIGMVVLRFISLYYRLNESVAGYTLTAGLVSVLQKGAYLFSSVYARDYYSAVLFVACFSMCCAAIVAISKREIFGSFRIGQKWNLYKNNIRFAAPLLLSAFVSVLITYIPQFAIRWEMGFAAVSIYAAASTVSLAINLVQSGFNVFWAPFVYAHHRDRQHEIMKMHEAVVMVSVTLCMLLAMASDYIFLVFKPDYAIGSMIVPVLSLSPLCYTIGETTGVGINIHFKTGYQFFINVCTLISCCVLTMVFVPLFGFAGAAASMALSSLLALLLKTTIGERLYQSVERKTFMLRGLIPYLIMCAISLTFPRMSPVKVLLEVFLLAVSLALYGKERLRWLLGVARRSI